MTHPFCPGYTGKFKTLVEDYPGSDVFPFDAFRVEWGPVFHRGRLNKTARICVIGQDPAAHENAARRILVGEAGQRVQGFLAKLGIEKSYVMVNALLYSAFDQGLAQAQVQAPAVVAYRNRWLDALLLGTKVTAVVALGGMAETAWNAWKATQPAAAAALTFVRIMHPTADAHAGTTTATLLTNWNAGLAALTGKVKADHVRPLVPYQAAFSPDELVAIPERDLPPGLPDWMRALEPWAVRAEAPVGSSGAAAVRFKRLHLSLSAPDSALP